MTMSDFNKLAMDVEEETDVLTWPQTRLVPIFQMSKPRSCEDRFERSSRIISEPQGN